MANETTKAAMTGGSAAKSVTAEQIKAQIKPLSKNAFAAFFQRIWRGWITWWYGFSDKHPKLSKAIYMLVFFILFSQGVTIFQFLIFNFGVVALQGTNLAGNNWGLPLIKMGQNSVTGEDVFFRILGASPRYDSSGALITGAGAGGLAYFIMFMIGTFLAQCINFPLQRNITFKSHGNPWYQAMWYFIGWVLIQPITMAIGSLWEGLRDIYLGSWPGFVTTLLNTIIMGGVAMVIFFFVFLVIFPDYAAVEKRAKKKLEKIKANGGTADEFNKAEAAVKDASDKALLSKTEKDVSKTTTQASAKAMAYFAAINNLEKVKAKSKTASDEAAKKQAKENEALFAAKLDKAFEKAVNAINAKDEAAAARQSALKVTA